MQRKDPISQQLRLVEAEVDNCHKGNILMQLPFGASAWYFMAFCEDIAIIDLLKGHRQTIHDAAVFADQLVMHLKNAFLWLHSSCGKGGSPQRAYDDDFYQAAKDLSYMSQNYGPFECAFTYASRGLIELSVRDSTIVSSPDFLVDMSYEAYDRLVKPIEIAPDFDKGDIFAFVGSLVRVNGSAFTYRLNPQLVSRAMEVLEPVLEARYSLPDHWQLSRYSMGDFKTISKCLMTIAYIHYIARAIAAMQGCEGLGYANSIFLASLSELTNRLARYSDCPARVVTALIEDMTYGSRGITNPDPAIQPLINLNDDLYAIMPNLFMNSSMERNFVVLLNKLPPERAIYSRLVKEKESLMRKWIMENLLLPNVRYFSGAITCEHKLSDIDLAVISEAERVCIFLELKWFVEPAEVREVIEKSEEIQKGVSQLLGLSDAMDRNPQPFFYALQIDASYKRVFVVASDSFIGMRSVQHPKVPVVRHRHLVRKANLLGSLGKLSTWLLERKYLPIEGKHYKVMEETWRIGRWGIKWYGIKPLVTEEFL